MNNKDKWKCITDAIDVYIDGGHKEQPKIYLHPSKFNELDIKPYKGCCFVYDNRIPEDEFLIAPLTHELD